MTIDLKKLEHDLDVWQTIDHPNWNATTINSGILRSFMTAARAYLDMAKSSRPDQHPSQLKDDEVDLIAKSKMPDPADRSQNTEY